jgi:hypothetical protein
MYSVLQLHPVYFIEYLLSEKQLALWNWANKNVLEFSRKDAVAALEFPE